MRVLSILLLLSAALSVKAQKNIREVFYFDHDEHFLNTAEQSKLDELLIKTKKLSLSAVQIHAYCDSNGSYAYNMQLSENRANELSQYLQAKGIADALIVKHSYGESKPVANSLDKNRRVELVFVFAFESFEIPAALLPLTQSFYVKPSRDTSIAIGSKGTMLHIPQGAFSDSEGKPIYRQVRIEFREYRNSAEMAFSNIKMTYEEEGISYNFNSSGMFEIRGYQGNEPVQLSPGKSIRVDYFRAAKIPNTSFFRLSADGKSWKKIKELDRLGEKDGFVSDGPGPAIIQEGIKGQRMMKVKSERVQVERVKVNAGNNNATLLAEGINLGHTYPDIIKGLNVKSFGVYNCDQIYRIPNLVSITAIYKNSEGNEITDPHVLSMIDLNYNGAFSFDPKLFTCNPQGNNVLALFTKSGKLYLLEKGQFGRMKIDKSGTYTFVLKDMSEQIKTSADLAKYLGVEG